MVKRLWLHQKIHSLLPPKKTELSILNRAPSVKQWWITAFNPEDKLTRSEDMVVVGKIDFSDYKNLYDSLNVLLYTDKMQK